MAGTPAAVLSARGGSYTLELAGLGELYEIVDCPESRESHPWSSPGSIFPH